MDREVKRVMRGIGKEIFVYFFSYERILYFL